MPRKARILVPGAFHHVMARAIESWVIRDHEFVKEVIEKESQRRIRLARYRSEKITLEEIARLVVSAAGITEKELCRCCRGGPISDARKVFSYVSRRIYEFPVKEIGNFLGISGPPVSISIPAGERLVKSGKNKINI